MNERAGKVHLLGVRPPQWLKNTAVYRLMRDVYICIHIHIHKVIASISEEEQRIRKVIALISEEQRIRKAIIDCIDETFYGATYFGRNVSKLTAYIHFVRYGQNKQFCP